MRWRTPVKLNLAGNPGNQSGLTEQEFFQAVTTGLQRWQAASGDQIHFDYWQGKDPLLYPSNSNRNGISSIYFASNATGDTYLSSNILGITQVWYNTNTGEIMETDIALNDKDFHFTNNSKDTSGYGSNHSTFTNGKSNVYIQNVITHELGHAFGLSHSGGLQSSMLFMESPEQNHLGCDEKIAIHALYPTSEDPHLRGSLSGSVVSSTGYPIFGAHVLAISQRRGTVLATALTDPSGNYTIAALEPGTYFLMAEPFYAGSSALPNYYSKINILICPENNAFERSFLTEKDNFHLKPISVEAGVKTSTSSLIVHCNGLENTLIEASSFPTLFNPNSNQNHEEDLFGVADRFKSSKTNDYLLKAISGHLEIHALAYSLYSPVHPSLTLLDSTGTAVTGENFDPIYTGESGYVNHDSALIIDGLSKGDYTLKVSAERLQVNDYPAGPIALDHTPFLVLTGGIQQKEPPPLSLWLPNNARCRDLENFPAYHSPEKVSTFSKPSQSNDNKTGSCAWLRSQDRQKIPHNPPLEAIVGWLLPWFCMAAFGKLATRLHASAQPVNLKEWEIHFEKSEKFKF